MLCRYLPRSSGVPGDNLGENIVQLGELHLPEQLCVALLQRLRRLLVPPPVCWRKNN